MSTSQNLQPDSVVEPSLALQWITVDDEMVVFDPLRNKVYRLNGTAAFFWRCIEARLTVADIEREVAAAYGLPAAQATEATGELLCDLLERGLVGATTGGNGEPPRVVREVPTTDSTHREDQTNGQLQRSAKPW